MFRMGELFNGPGGLGLGAHLASEEMIRLGYPKYSIEHIWANDMDESACDTYENNIGRYSPELRMYRGPVQDIDIPSLERINALSFGFPCNDFSNVGERRGFNGEYGPLYTYGVSVLNHHNPMWFVAENVSGLQSSNDGNAFRTILNDLTNAGQFGYVLTPHLYKFEQYGVPQSRHRIIIVGIRRDLGINFKIPRPTHTPTRPAPEGFYPYKTAMEAIENPPIPTDAKNHEFTRHAPKVVEMLSYIPEGSNAWDEAIPERLRLNVKGARLSQIYKRLDRNQPAYTVTGSGGGGTHVYHWEENRALTNRERARLQTFPDHFEFSGSKEQVRKQIGMAVPPAGAKVIFEAILKTFAGVKYDSIDSYWWNKLGVEIQETINI